MEEAKCKICGREAQTFKELATGECGHCGGELEEEKGDESTASEMGMDSDL